MFSRVRTALLVGLLIFAVTYFLFFAVDDINQPESLKNAASFIPSIALSLAFQNIVLYELGYKGLNSETLNNDFKNYKFSTAYYMIAINIASLVVLGLYLEQVWPNE